MNVTVIHWHFSTDIKQCVLPSPRGVSPMCLLIKPYPFASISLTSRAWTVTPFLPDGELEQLVGRLKLGLGGTGLALKEDYQSALKKFLKTVRCLNRGKQFSVTRFMVWVRSHWIWLEMLFGGGRNTSGISVNPTATGAGDFGEDSFIAFTKVTESGRSRSWWLQCQSVRVKLRSRLRGRF